MNRFGPALLYWHRFSEFLWMARFYHEQLLCLIVSFYHEQLCVFKFWKFCIYLGRSLQQTIMLSRLQGPHVVCSLNVWVRFVYNSKEKSLVLLTYNFDNLFLTIKKSATLYFSLYSGDYFPLQLTDMEFIFGAGWDDLTLRFSDFAMQCNKRRKVIVWISLVH